MDNIDVLNYSLQLSKRDIETLKRGLQKVIDQDAELLSATSTTIGLKAAAQALIFEIDLMEKLKEFK